MHALRPWNRLRNWLFGAGLAAMFGSAGMAEAQTPVPGTLPSAAARLGGTPVHGAVGQAAPAPRPVAADSVTIFIGETQVLQPSPGVAITDVELSRSRIVEVLQIDPMRPDQVRVRAVNIGEVTVTLTNQRGGVFRVPMRVEPDLGYIRREVARRFPRATVTIDPAAAGSVILTGTVDAAEDLEPISAFIQGFIPGRIINNLSVRGPMQVQLEVCVALVNRSELRQFGFNFFFANEDTAILSTVGGLISTPAVNIGGNAGGGAVTFTRDLAGGSANLVFSLFDEDRLFEGFLQALRNEGLTKILANPTLTTLSGRPASFLVGGEQPIPVPSGVGGSAVGIEYREFGTRLTFLPVVLGEGRIRLEVEPEVSQIAQQIQIQNIPVPIFQTNRVHTTVEIENGQTLAIGGLLQNTVIATTTKVPVLGDLPFLGAGFRRVSYNESEQELLIIVTPRLVDALDCRQMTSKLPGQETRTPTDFELFLEGILEAPRGHRPIIQNWKYKAAHDPCEDDIRGSWLKRSKDCGPIGCSTCVPHGGVVSPGHHAAQMEAPAATPVAESLPTVIQATGTEPPAPVTPAIAPVETPVEPPAPPVPE